MAVAAYSSVLSLLCVVDNMRHPAHLRLFPDLTQIIDDLRLKLCFLQDLFEVHSSKITKEVLERVVRRIPRVVCEAEILIDNFVVDQLQRELEDLQRDDDAEGRSCSIESFHGEISQVVREIAQIIKALQTLSTTAHQHDQEQPRKSDDRPLTWSGGEKGKAVGFDDQVGQVLEKLARNQTNLVIVPIVGMGGIGKTTLARSLFDHPYNSDRFLVRIWLTISQDYSVKKVLEGLLNDGVLRDTKDRGGQSEAALIAQLHQKLFGQRYLIVLDDVWSLEAWDDLRRGFPDNGNGSRVLVTTRLSEIASSLGSHQDTTHSMEFLDEDKSWDLFSEKAFKRSGRSLELEEIGREISRRCRGLPLMLVVVGGLLANSDMTVRHWRYVAGNMKSVVSSANDEYCSRILSLSYEHLPIHLKACFLHTRHFDEDTQIRASHLIDKWVAQGFIKPMSGRSLEEAARKYLEDLVGRNILFVRKRGRSGNTKYCGVHDLLRDLSIKESDKEQLLELPKDVTLKDKFVSKRCVICAERNRHTTIVFGKMPVCGSCWSISSYARSRYVLVVVKSDSQRIPLPTTCRYINLIELYKTVVLNTICLIWNLEVLRITGTNVVLPKELWELPRLTRVVSGSRLELPDPGNNFVVLENLQTLDEVSETMFTDEIVRRIPNLRKLAVEYYDHQSRRDWPRLYLQNLSRLQNLERLRVNCYSASIDIKKYNIFSCSLKELILRGCEIVGWDSMTIIGSLPNLQLLTLSHGAVLGDEWNPIEGEFLKLKILHLAHSDLARWSADETHFPALEDLYLTDMKYLEAVPREFGGLNTLNYIRVHDCRDSAVDSLTDILEEQQSNGNEELVIEWSCNGLRELHVTGDVSGDRKTEDQEDEDEESDGKAENQDDGNEESDEEYNSATGQ